MNNKSAGNIIFNTANNLFIIAITLLCILPLLNVLAVSLSSNTAASSGEVGCCLWASILMLINILC